MPAPKSSPAKLVEKASPTIEIVEKKKTNKNRYSASSDTNGTHSVKNNGNEKTGRSTNNELDENAVINVSPDSVKKSFSEQPDRVIVTYYLRGIDNSCCNVNFEEKSFKVTLRSNEEKFLSSFPQLRDNKTTIQWDVALRNSVVPEKCSLKVTPSALELRLCKADSVSWGSLSPVTETSPRSQTGEWKPIVAPAKEQPRLPEPPKPTKLKEDEQEVNVPVGYTGLENIGNTCFMNSVIQCLANTPALRNYFLSSKFQQDINKDNPLGLKGNLAVAFAVLLRQMWSGKRQSVAPAALKKLVASKASQFEGYAQHDAQEFMAFLLDGLHEDLNRVKEKPYTSTIESNGRPDAEVAEEAWRIHKLRNDSLIVDLFQGQYKSTLHCPACHNVSVTFDPFLFLSLPLPRPRRKLSAFLFYRDTARQPLLLTVAVNGDSRVKDFRSELAAAAGLDPSVLRIIEVFKGRIHRLLEDYISVDSIQANDVIFAFETLLPDSAKDEVVEIPVIQRILKPELPAHCSSCKKEASSAGLKLKRCSKCCRVAYCDAGCQRSHWETHKPNCHQAPEIIGHPFVISVRPQEATNQQLYKTLLNFARFSVSATQVKNSENEAQPMFLITPVDLQGQNVELSSPAGDEVLDLSQVPALAVDWRNDPNLADYCVVTSKPLEDSCALKNVAGSEVNDSLTLDLCLQQFMQPERLAKEEAWYCPKCKEHREATKQLALWRLPDILVVQLKRFSFKNLLWRDKINKKVDYPIRGLDLSAYIPQPGESSNAVYDLYAVVNHYGGILTGHYTAFARCLPLSDASDDQQGWRLMDDSRVTNVEEENVISPAAYLLFYQRRSLRYTNPEELD